MTAKTLWALSAILAGCSATPVQPDPMTRMVEYLRAETQTREPWSDVKINPSDCYVDADAQAGPYIASITALDLNPDGRLFLVNMGECGSTTQSQRLFLDRRGRLTELDLHIHGNISTVRQTGNGAIEVTALVFANDDPRCCPSRETHLTVPIDW